MKKLIFKILFCILFLFVLYYFMLPPLNLSSFDFWMFLFISTIVCFVICSVISLKENLTSIVKIKNIKSKYGYFVFLTIPVIIFIIIIINVINSPMLSARSYYERIAVENGVFLEDIDLVDFDKLALLDKDSSSKLGDRVMGQMTDLVSQFSVSNIYTQINYNDLIVRVTPLEYASLIKYFTNRKDGVKGYITVNSVNGETNLVRLEQGMKYMPSSLFFENLNRYLRFKYPTEIFGEISFEIDENGSPYWVVQTLKYSGVNLKEEVKGIIVLNPIDGTSVDYKVNEVPSWIDHVYSADLIIEQLDDWGKYKNGFLNSIFGQKEVVMATDGYNYLAMDDDIYLYTGITSVSNDESNIGFVLTNLRTKQTKFYDVPGAEEYSAMASSEGQVQQMKYNSTFPLLINLDNKPTYLMSLKDNAGLVKMYAFVDYTDYQKVVVTDANEGILNAAKNYLGKSVINSDIIKKEIEIEFIKTAVIDGTTYYYIKADNNYRTSIKVNEKILPFLVAGDKVTITYQEADLNEIIEIE